MVSLACIQRADLSKDMGLLASFRKTASAISSRGDELLTELLRAGWGTNIGQPNADGSATLCNGGGALRSCWNFTAEFSAEFNDAHRWVLNTSQDMLAKLPKKGPTVSDDTILSLSCYATDSGSRPFCHLRPQPQATLMSTGQRPVLPVGRPRGRSLRLRHHA